MSDYWHFQPSLALCIIALALFTISTLWHILLLMKYRQNSKFFIPFVIGGIFQIAGYIARIFCTQDLDNFGAYVAQTLFILLAPILYSASIYSMLQRLIQYVNARSLIPLRPVIITTLFVAVDILSLILQATGGGMQASGDLEKIDTGSTVVLVGLGIQLAFFAFFTCLTATFDLRTRNKEQIPTQGKWRRLLRALELSCVLIMIRSIYRLVEYAGGYDGYLMNHEVYFYVFDTLMMLLTQVVYNVIYPGAILIPYTTTSSERERETEGKVDVEMQGPINTEQQDRQAEIAI